MRTDSIAARSNPAITPSNRDLVIKTDRAICRARTRAGADWVALLVQHHLSDAASFVFCVFRHVIDHINLPNDSLCLKKTCVREVVLDKWFPPMVASSYLGSQDRLQGSYSAARGVIQVIPPELSPRHPLTPRQPRSTWGVTNRSMQL